MKIFHSVGVTVARRHIFYAIQASSKITRPQTSSANQLACFRVLPVACEFHFLHVGLSALLPSLNLWCISYRLIALVYLRSFDFPYVLPMLFFPPVSMTLLHRNDRRLEKFSRRPPYMPRPGALYWRQNFTCKVSIGGRKYLRGTSHPKR